jgi:hypothetical protein
MRFPVNVVFSGAKAYNTSVGPAKVFNLKGIDRPFRGRVESILIQSLLVNWRLGYFLNLILKGLLHKISKKPLEAA